MKPLLVIKLLLISLITACQNTSTPVTIINESSLEITTQDEEIQYTSEVFLNNNNEWGYQILKNGKTYINQPHIPAIQGNKGFKTKEHAKKTAAFVIIKLENGNPFPTLTINILDSLKVLN